MKIKDILGINNARLINGNELAKLTFFSKDTRTLKPQDVYVAFKGENFDGNAFLEEALKKGASTGIVSKVDEKIISKYADKNIILVDDTLDFITNIAKLKRAKLNIPVIAITGSVGKTSTKNLIASLLETQYKVLKTSKNLNTKIGLALTLLNYTNEDCIVLEMGMNMAGEIAALSNIAKPTIGIITNIGTSHIGNLGSRQNILNAKLEILEGLNGPLIINNDNDLLHAWYKKNPNYNVITFGINNESDYTAHNITYSPQGCTFSISNHHFMLPTLGQAFIYNALAAYIVGQKLNISIENTRKTLAHIQKVEHRLEIISKNNITIIDDTYNASYDSLALALEVLSHFKTRKIAVLGDVLELGQYSEEIHRQIGKLVINNQIDVIICTGASAKYIYEEAKKKIAQSFYFKDNKEVLAFLKKYLKANDTILIKASHGMNFLEIVNGMLTQDK